MAAFTSTETTLTDYPRPSVAVDVAVLTVRANTMCVVVVQSPRGPALPGTFLHPGERLRDAADRALTTKAGLEGLEFYQIGMFDDPQRDERGWVLSMAHSAIVPYENLGSGVDLVKVIATTTSESLAFDHDAMVELAVQDMRRRYESHADPAHLLGERFTLLELRRLYELVYGKQLPKDTFRRHVSAGIEGTGDTSTAGGGRPAELYRRKARTSLPESAAAFFRS